ncbi:MAG TPA: hypothetical protein VE135_05220 [Pyrinomonadaceae bacterium]|nr:hypothetical protein [Pyrinomonadaceae bacterium]
MANSRPGLERERQPWELNQKEGTGSVSLGMRALARIPREIDQIAGETPALPGQTEPVPKEEINAESVRHVRH